MRIRIVGRFTHCGVADARAELLDAVNSGAGDLEVDLDGVAVTDRTVLGLLLEVHHRAERSERRLVLVNVSADVDRLLRRCGLARVLHQRGPDEVLDARGSLDLPAVEQLA